MDLNFARDTTTGREGLELVAHVRALDAAPAGHGDDRLVDGAARGRDHARGRLRLRREALGQRARAGLGRPSTSRAGTAAAARAGWRRTRSRSSAACWRAGRPVVPGFDIGAAWSFAEALGGDALGGGARPGGRLAVAIADVCGKGMPAALLMASTLATLEDLLAAACRPRRSAASSARILAPRLGDERFVSLACVIARRGAALRLRERRPSVAAAADAAAQRAG